MKRLFAAIVAAAAFGSGLAAPGAQAPKTADWAPLDANVWKIVTQDPEAHFLRAQKDLSEKNPEAAAAEIRRADSFLELERKRLAVSSRELKTLAEAVRSGEIVSPKQTEAVFSRAMSVLNETPAMIPEMAGARAMYADEADYHLAQADSLLKQGKEREAAEDIRRAEAYLKLSALHAGEAAKAELAASAAALEELAGRAEAGGEIVQRDAERTFRRASKAVRVGR